MTLFGEVPAKAVLYINKPTDGEVTGPTELIAVSATRGGNNPLLVDFTSSMAELSAALPSLLMATCENDELVTSRIKPIKKNNFFMLQCFF